MVWNSLYVVNWDGKEIKSTGRATIRNSSYLFKAGIEWGRISSSKPSFRKMEEGFFHESASGVAFPPSTSIDIVLGFLNLKVATYYLSIFNPTLTFQWGDSKDSVQNY